MKEIVYLLIGAAIGAAIALLYAPETGADLRSELRAKGQEDMQKMRSDWQREVQDLNNRLSMVQAQLDQKHQSQSESSEASS